ncbi:MAG: host attachment protein, partial [Ensifer adhaerens]
EYSSDPVREEKHRFAVDVVSKLEGYLNDNAFDSLVICAAPKTLGDLRKLLSANVRHRTVAEIDRNCVTVPIEQLIATARSAVYP